VQHGEREGDRKRAGCGALSRAGKDFLQKSARYWKTVYNIAVELTFPEFDQVTADKIADAEHENAQKEHDALAKLLVQQRLLEALRAKLSDENGLKMQVQQRVADLQQERDVLQSEVQQQRKLHTNSCSMVEALEGTNEELQVCVHVRVCVRMRMRVCVCTHVYTHMYVYV